jgi:hypothetical protein
MIAIFSVEKSWHGKKSQVALAKNSFGKIIEMREVSVGITTRAIHCRDSFLIGELSQTEYNSVFVVLFLSLLHERLDMRQLRETEAQAKLELLQESRALFSKRKSAH